MMLRVFIACTALCIAKEPAGATESKPASLSRGPWAALPAVPWGTGPGKLKEEINSKDERQTFRGPTRFLVFEDGSISILDTLGNCVKEFDPDGKARGSVSFPATDQYDAETLCVDMAALKQGEYWLLSLGQRAVLHVTAAGHKSYPISGLTQDSVLMSITADGQGNLYVLDGNDGSIHRMDSKGKGLPKLTNVPVQTMTCDASGRFYDLRLVGQDARDYELIRWTPGGKVETIGKLESKEGISRFDVFGVDREGRVYIFTCAGAIERPSRIEVVRFGPDGKETGRVEAPDNPAEPKFVHGKAVSPEGVVYAVEVTSTGLALLKLKGF